MIQTDTQHHETKTTSNTKVIRRIPLERPLSANPLYLWIGPKTEIMVVLVDNEPRAFHSLCPHMGARLNYDEKKQAVVCPWHGLEYDSESLESQHHRYKKLCEIDVQVESNELVIGVKP